MATRSRRHTLLAAASAVGVVAGCVLIATETLVLADRSGFDPTFRLVSDWTNVVGAVAVAAAFAVSWEAFLQGAHERRVRLLAIGAGLFAAYGASLVVGPLLELMNDSRGAPWKFLAADAAFSAHGVALLFGASLLALAVLSRPSGRMAGWACLLVAAQFALTAAAYGFELADTYDFVTPAGRVVVAIAAIGTGYFIAAIASLIAAIAFATGGLRRDRKLGAAAIVCAAGFLSIVGGFVLLATLGVDARICLDAAYPFVLAVAAGVGAAAFFSPREAPQF